MKRLAAAPFVGGLRFAEGPRWRDGRLWFSDIVQGRVFAADPDGSLATVAEIERPSGLGFLPDGALLVVGMASRLLFRVDSGGVRAVADLTALGSALNDMVVARNGDAYIDWYRSAGRFAPLPGADGTPLVHAADPDRYYVNGLGIAPDLTGGIALVRPDGTVRCVAEGLDYPNGLAITPDGGTLIASLSNAGRLVAFAIAADGTLGAPRTWAELPGRHPDGICLDAEGGLWVASVATSAFLRVLEGGEITHHVATPGRWAVSCALGGAERRTLFAISMEAIDVPGHRSWIERVEVDAPGAGLP